MFKHFKKKNKKCQMNKPICIAKTHLLFLFQVSISLFPFTSKNYLF